MLASAPSLPPAAMQGHVMPSFPHTLICLGPFANLGYQIVFSKHAVLVIHPDGHSILDGWREQDGPRLWHFSLKATMPILPEFDKKCTGTIDTVSKKGATMENVPVRSLPLKATRPILPEFAKKCTDTIGTVSKTGATMENVPVRSTPPLPPTSPPQATKPSLLLSALSEKYEEPGPRRSSANFLSRLLLTQFSAPLHFPCLPRPAQSQQLLLHNPIPPRDAWPSTRRATPVQSHTCMERPRPWR